MNYRPEIDGLRAVAVLPVILFHTGMPSFAGGFVGVDVFFVISGYLITTLLIADLSEDRFSLVTFYYRRARRILPALFFVMACTVPFAWAWMLPDQFGEYTESVIGTALFVSNIVFWRQSSYFGNTAEEKPLLHTWSLAIEEQFYVFFPLFLLLIWPLSLRLRLQLVIAVSLVSFGLAEYFSRVSPSATFYLLPSRAWELLAGSLAAFWVSRRGLPSHGGLALLGLGLIAVSVVWFDKDTRFPGIYALLPVAGTVLVILCTAPQTMVGRVLSLRPVVAIGLISYSAYLWHQPLFAFARIRSLTAPSDLQYILLALLSLGLAALTWRFVEQPFRRRGVSRRLVFGFSAASILAFCGLAGYLLQADWANRRLAASGVPIGEVLPEDRIAPNRGLGDSCISIEFKQDLCSTSDITNVVLWGDSYAMHMAQFLQAGLVEFEQATLYSCIPLAETGNNTNGVTAAECKEFNSDTLKYILNNEHIDTVLISSKFWQFFELDRKIHTSLDVPVADRKRLFSAALKETLDAIKSAGKSAVVVFPPPFTGDNIAVCLQKATFFGTPLNACDFSSSDFNPAYVALKRTLEPLTNAVETISLESLICDAKRCRASMDGVYIYRDAGHLTREGSKHLGELYYSQGSAQ